jgi:SAM-dependent methyltransferase
MVDYCPPPEPIAGCRFLRANLNESWPTQDGEFEFVFAIEVIEHVENPRHFMRELCRSLRPGGYGFVSTPNNHSLASVLTFLCRGQHRRFQAPSYPAHLTPMLRCDLDRILSECSLQPLKWFYSNEDTLPLLHWTIRLPGLWFSDSCGVLFRREEEGPARPERCRSERELDTK